MQSERTHDMRPDTQHGIIRFIGKKFIKPESAVTLVAKDCLVTSSEEFTLPDRSEREGIL